MRRREFIAFVDCTAAAWPLLAGAPRIAVHYLIGRNIETTPVARRSMTRRGRIAGAAMMLAGTLLLVMPAMADDADRCQKQSGDVAIAECTRAINSSRYSGHNLSVLYTKRGFEYGYKGELDRAIADYNQ